ncbi:MAG: alpha/beta hydrolase [Spirochaetes bacterium]|nr:alpha/beta hydrolase [Spirochaetota bacterium]
MRTPLFCLCLAVAVSAATGPGMPGLSAQDAGRWKSVAEPVFKGTIWLYDSGARRDTTVVLVHGVGQEASEVWKPVIPALERRYRVVAFDLPGFGRSSKANELYSPENYAKLLHFVARKYQSGRLVVVGHSLGASVSLFYAGMYPDEPDRLVVADAAGILHRASLIKGRFLVQPKSKVARFFADRPLSLLNRVIESTIGSIDNTVMPEDLERYVDNELFRKAVLKENAQRVAGISLISTDFSPQLYAVKAPACIIWGGSDEIAPLRTSLLLERVLPAAARTVMPGRGHDPITESPEEFTRLLLRSIEMDDASFTPGRRPVPGGQSVVVTGERAAELTGDYDTVTIDSCGGVLLKNLTARSLVIRESTVVMEGFAVDSAGDAIAVTDSRVTMTGGSLRGDVGIVAEESRFDMAGVSIEAKSASVQAKEDCRFIFSVCRVKSPRRSGTLHGAVELEQGDSI